jgi:hypothetical protein
MMTPPSAPFGMLSAPKLRRLSPSCMSAGTSRETLSRTLAKAHRRVIWIRSARTKASYQLACACENPVQSIGKLCMRQKARCVWTGAPTCEGVAVRQRTPRGPLLCCNAIRLRVRTAHAIHAACMQAQRRHQKPSLVACICRQHQQLGGSGWLLCRAQLPQDAELAICSTFSKAYGRMGCLLCTSAVSRMPIKATGAVGLTGARHCATNESWGEAARATQRRVRRQQRGDDAQQTGAGIHPSKGNVNHAILAAEAGNVAACTVYLRVAAPRVQGPRWPYALVWEARCECCCAMSSGQPCVCPQLHLRCCVTPTPLASFRRRTAALRYCHSVKAFYGLS